MELRNFAFSTSGYKHLPLPRALSQIAAAGFAHVDILADKPHLWLDRMSPAERASLRTRLEKLKLATASLNANSTAGFWTDAPSEPLFEPSLISAERSLREWRITYIRKALRLARDLGAHAVTITSGRALRMPPEKAQKILMESLLRLAEYAESLGQRLALECQPGLLIERYSELQPLLKKIDAPFLGASLDAAALSLSGENAAKAIASLKGRIFNVRLADIRDGKNFRRVPGEGAVNFSALFRALEAADYTGPLNWDLDTCYDAPDSACSQTLKYVKTLRKA